MGEETKKPAPKRKSTKKKSPSKKSTAKSPSAKMDKKSQITSLYKAGITDVTDLAAMTQSRPSYVASVLEKAEGLEAYFDLYTSTSKPMNLYSKFFAGKLGFRDEQTAKESIDHIALMYEQFDNTGDRAGQHHALVMALTMFDRARWTGKEKEADIFRAWLVGKLEE